MAGKTRITLVVEQCDNPRYDDSKPMSDANWRYVYRIAHTVNTVEHAVGQFLTKIAVQTLLQDGVTIRVKKA